MPDSVSDMRTTIQIVFTMVREAFLSRAALHLENLALRQQLAVVHRKSPRPSLGTADRLFWVVPPFYLIRATNGSFAVGGDALFTAKEARCFPETAFGFVCLPSATFLARREVPANPWRSRWRLHRHTRTLKRNPAVFRPQAARTDDGARRPVETPRSFRCRRDHKEIDRSETAHMVVEERPPGLRRRLRMPRHVSRYSRLADINAQLQ